MNARTMIVVALPANGRTQKTAARTRSERIRSRRRLSRSTSGAARSPIRMIGRKSAIRRALTHLPEPVRSNTSTVSATAARYVPAPEPSVARKRRRKSGAVRRTAKLRMRGTLASGPGGLPRFGLVRQVGAQPALRLGQRNALAGCVVLDLIPRDAADREVLRVRMAEVEPAHGRGWRHREALRQGEPCRLRVEQVEEPPLLGVVGARRVAERRADAAVALLDQLLARRLRVGLVPLAPRPQMEPLGERLGETVRERLDHDRAVVVV